MNRRSFLKLLPGIGGALVALKALGSRSINLRRSDLARGWFIDGDGAEFNSLNVRYHVEEMTGKSSGFFRDDCVIETADGVKYYFSGPVNKIEEGVPVPMLFGETPVGSIKRS